MKSLVFILVCICILACNTTNNDSSKSNKNYVYKDLTVNFVRDTRVTTFIRDGKPISGTVTRKMRNGMKNVWNVEKGLAVKQTMYYPNGQMERMLEMKNGVEHGIFVMYFSDGTKYVEQFYNNGEPTGVWHRWNKDGYLVETIEY